MSVPPTLPRTTAERPTRRLSSTECQDWLSRHTEGRLGYSSGRGHRSVVVSYAFDRGHIVVRLPDYNDIVHYAPGAEVTLDVDEEPTPSRLGRETVSVSGRAELAGREEDLGEVDFAETWPDGVGTSVVRLPLTAVEGYERTDR